MDRFFSPCLLIESVSKLTTSFEAFTFCLFSDVNMVRKYIKTTDRANINDETDAAAAINDVTNGNCSLRIAAATYGIHFATLQYRLTLFCQKHQSLIEEPDLEDEGEEIM